jgi:hypothetical protein
MVAAGIGVGRVFARSFHEAIIIGRNFDSSKEPGAE